MLRLSLISALTITFTVGTAIANAAEPTTLKIAVPQQTFYPGEGRVLVVQCSSSDPTFAQIKTALATSSCSCLNILDLPPVVDTQQKGTDLKIGLIAPERDGVLFGGVIGIRGINSSGQPVAIRISVDATTRDPLEWSQSDQLLNLGRIPAGEMRVVRSVRISRRSPVADQPSWSSLTLSQQDLSDVLKVTLVEEESGKWRIDISAGSIKKTGVYSLAYSLSLLSADGGEIPYRPARNIRVGIDGSVIIRPSMLVRESRGRLLQDQIHLQYTSKDEHPRVVQIVDGGGNLVNHEITPSEGNMGAEISLSLPPSFDSLRKEERYLEIQLSDESSVRVPVMVMAASK